MDNDKNAFELSVDQQNVATLTFDLPGEKVNKFSMAVLAQLESLLDSLAVRKDIEVLLIRSGKPDIFIAGADLHAFEPAFKDPSILDQIIHTGHRVFNKLAKLPFPTVAVIHGACLGGGLEMALACSHRIASDSPKTQIGLPEVTLGIIPGWGGTQRLPRLVGLAEGLPMVVSGKAIAGYKAYKIHLIDRLIAWEWREPAIAQFVAELKSTQGRKKILSARAVRPFKNKALECNSLGRRLIFNTAEKEIFKNTKGQYFAPKLALDVIEKTYHLPLTEGLKEEIATFVNNSHTGLSQAPNLIDLFFSQEALKKEKWLDPAVKPRTVNSLAILGAGTMGSTMAWLVAQSDIPVRLKDVDNAVLGKGLNHIKTLFDKGVAYRKLSTEQAQLLFLKVSPTLDYTGFKGIDFAIEAVPENLDLKHTIFRELEERIPSDAIIASNTSSFTVAEMSEGMKHPERFIGLHFFNPANKIPLVEVVPGPHTSPEVVATAIELCRRIGKKPIVVKDCPGFLVNRIFVSGANEVLHMLQEGIPMAQIEKVLLDFGMPMSPFVLSDEVGNDVFYKAAKQLEKAYGPRMQCPQILEEMYNKKLFGKKNGRGFYLYNGNKSRPNPEISSLVARSGCHKTAAAVADELILNRFLLIMVNEAWRCLQEKVIGSPAYLDLALIMGMGFPPFHGGLLKYADQLGCHNVVTLLNRYAQDFGPRFTPFNVEMAVETPACAATSVGSLL